MDLTWVTVFDYGLVVLATIRLMVFFMMDDLGRKPMERIEKRIRLRLPPERLWIADGFTCPFCLGFWIGLGVVLSYVCATALPDPSLLVWRIVMAALALNYVAAHVMLAVDAYDGADDQEDDE